MIKNVVCDEVAFNLTDMPKFNSLADSYVALKEELQETDEELKEVVGVATKYHEDNSYDYKANLKDTTLAKLVKNLVIDKEVNKDKIIKQALEEIYLLADMNKDSEIIKSKLQ